VEAIALVLNAMFRILGLLVLWWLGVFIAPTTKVDVGGWLLVMGASDSLVRHQTGTVGCPVRRHVTQLLGFGSSRTLELLYSCGTGQSGAPLTSALTSGAHCSRTVQSSQSTIARVSRCSAGASDSPVAHRTVR
jgi:hypothetical protein